MVRSFSGSETSELCVSYSNEGSEVGAHLGKFDISDSNERFWQRFRNVKIRKQKSEDLKNLKCCLELRKILKVKN